MKRNYPFVRSAPRGAEELESLDVAVQLKILNELRALSAGGLITQKRFSGLTGPERAAYLEEALSDFDKATAYSVRGVASPVRTADDQQNQTAWDQFALRVEDAVTDLTREDCKQVTTHYLDGGVLIVGYKPPRERHDPFALGPRVIAIPLSHVPGGQGEVSETLTRLMSELAVLGTRGLQAGSREVQETIERFFQGKPAAYLQEAVQRIEIVAEAMRTNADVPKSVSSHMLPLLQKIVDVLKGRIGMQLC
jgi:hypothetical protein